MKDLSYFLIERNETERTPRRDREMGCRKVQEELGENERTREREEERKREREKERKRERGKRRKRKRKKRTQMVILTVAFFP